MGDTYSATTRKQDGVEIVTLRGADGAFAEIAPAHGNNCYAFGVGESVLEPVTLADFLAKPTGFGIPILFPYPNRVRDGRFTFGGEEFSVEPKQHGYVRQRRWTVVDSGSGDDAAWVTSRFEASDYPEEILEQFPFAFVLDVTYTLRGAALEMETTVTSAADRPFPFGFGIHPYFRRPRRGTVTVPARRRWELEEKLPTGRTIGIDGGYDLSGGADAAAVELDDIYTDLVAGDGGLVRCSIEDAERATRTVIEFDAAEFPNVVVFTPPAPRWAICVEPNSCPTDAFNLAARGVESNLLVLEPGGRRRFGVRFVVE